MKVNEHKWKLTAVPCCQNVGWLLHMSCRPVGSFGVSISCISRDREAERQRERETERQRDRVKSTPAQATLAPRGMSESVLFQFCQHAHATWHCPLACCWCWQQAVAAPDSWSWWAVCFGPSMYFNCIVSILAAWQCFMALSTGLLWQQAVAAPDSWSLWAVCFGPSMA